ncbi:hypothetical protein DACRYDRAFT_21685 [Dacryopinax primogenitus]|uniref:Uncharacterized protein n=1 Tax=Dacryopinax primogenitus (strain DJM 731) TaxID=1858805 RepID=M5G9V2_DACPD|nr:uncharacterized protein DACRYDRAFT_21685 [Dacryopinax primogenitus]EJU02657.1 hypothetical protein DACRYDRAFT_21685 [Dacryopinax primogenitus]
MRRNLALACWNQDTWQACTDLSENASQSGDQSLWSLDMDRMYKNDPLSKIVKRSCIGSVILRRMRRRFRQRRLGRVWD